MTAERVKTLRLRAKRRGGWWLTGWAAPEVLAGLTARGEDPARLLRQLPAAATVQTEQVHGASVAVISQSAAPRGPISGADAMLTHLAGVALQIQTADCLPIFYAAASGVIGLAHVGWRGLTRQLPARMIWAFRQFYQCRPETVRVAIGPAIRACCYEVGPELEALFGPFVQRHGGRRTVDLIGAAIRQLRDCGVRSGHLADAAVCTACDGERWCSVRRDGASAGRVTSLVMRRG
jgi:YfiH family protein